jgi:plasmid stabilization system protein ParE
LQRQLEEALSGIDQDFSVEEALQVLDLLEQQNREPLEAPRGGPVGPADY